MSSGLPEGKKIRIRSFYGFGPEEGGYVGWTRESSRDAYLRKLNDGDLIMIYGARSERFDLAYALVRFQFHPRYVPEIEGFSRS